MRANRTDALFILVGIGLIAVAVLRLLNPADYLPADPRSEPWFYPVSSGVLAAFGLLFAVAGVVRLLRRGGE
jgi:hypothetical protein